MALNERLLSLRKKRGLTLRQLSEQVGITAAALSSYEKGDKEPSLGFCIRLANFYGVSLDDLCGLTSGAPAMSERASKADVARMVTALCECGILIDLDPTEKIVIKDCIDNGSKHTLGNYEGTNTSHGMLMMIGGDWIYNFAEKYKGLLKLYYDDDIDKEVLQAWKEKKFAEYEGDFDLCEIEDIFDL